ncbi:MAG: adenosylmethionine--8-amino-7-oxononanoate transaminase [Nitrospiraceae bacterium]|nr:adenosylmethionine--8-amino-7-oxononanoate transaminase [Nitrospiraceae bacterium]
MIHPEDINHIKQSDRQFIWHPFTQMKQWLDADPVIITEAKDCFLKDANGRWYLDAVSSLWVNIHGHRRREIDDAIKAQLDKVAHSTLLGLGNIPSASLAEKLIQTTDRSFADLRPRLSKVFYSDNGSTAVEVALKMAFQYWMHKGKPKKQQFIGIKNGYHGDTIGAMAVGNVDTFHSTFGPLFFKTKKAPSPYCYRCELGKTHPDCGLACLDAMENILKTDSENIAAVILEPMVQAAGGMIIWPDGYLDGVRTLCTNFDVLLIADEVATGFGRTGRMFACEHAGIVPDLMCVSKGITNGYMPLAATLSTDEIYNAFLGEFSELKTFFHGHSYTGNPLACAAAGASLRIFETDNTLENMKPKTELLKIMLNEIANLPIVGDMRSLGLMAGIELVKDKQTKEPFPWEAAIGWRVALKAREMGIMMRPLGNILVVMPPLSILIDDLKYLLESLKKTIIAVSEE